MKPKYSICMCNYNMADTIERSLTSLIEQLDDRFEVVVADDGSTDSSIDVIKQLQKSYPQLRLISLKRDPKRKLGYTRNISIKEARGEFVLLHLDCDDVFGPYLADFIQVFHKIEKCIGYNILLSGQHINMANREFLLNHGPYLNLYRCEDRNLWLRMAAMRAYIPLDHIDFITRLPKRKKKRTINAIINTIDHMRYDFRTGITIRKYINYQWKKRSQHSLKLIILKIIMLIPARIIALFDKPISQNNTMDSPEIFALYREHTRGTYYELMRRHGCDEEIEFYNSKAREIFMQRESTNELYSDSNMCSIDKSPSL